MSRPKQEDRTVVGVTKSKLERLLKLRAKIVRDRPNKKQVVDAAIDLAIDEYEGRR